MAESKSKLFDSPNSFTELLKSVMTTPKSILSEFQLQEFNGENSNNDIATNHIDGVMERTKSDGYNWRKYGQKNIKSSESSRSYYRCTFADCHAKKKVQHASHSGRVIDVVYDGIHNHDPPQTKGFISRKVLRNADVASGFVFASPPIKKVDGSFLSLPCKDLSQESSLHSSDSVEQRKVNDPEPKQLSESLRINSHERACAELGDKHGVESVSKRRMIEKDLACREAKTVNEPKRVIYAVAEYETSSDGFKWRKYGQKFVGGNSNPRSYYRCTHAGCLVRKHVERVNPESFMVSFDGKHNHEMVAPEKHNRALAITRADEDFVETSGKRQPEQPLDRKCDCKKQKIWEQMDEKALESARTLLSIGTELRGF